MSSYRNWPVKYAVMPIAENLDWLERSKIDESFSEVAYLVSKVYLLSETKLYFPDGNYRKSYEVVFPYKTPYDLKKRRVPQYGINDFYIGTDIVEKVFDSYDEALLEASKKNNMIKNRLRKSVVCTGINLLEQMELSDYTFDERLKKYKEFEEAALMSSEDMVVTSSKGIESKRANRVLLPLEKK